MKESDTNNKKCQLSSKEKKTTLGLNMLASASKSIQKVKILTIPKIEQKSDSDEEGEGKSEGQVKSVQQQEETKANQSQKRIQKKKKVSENIKLLDCKEFNCRTGEYSQSVGGNHKSLILSDQYIVGIVSAGLNKEVLSFKRKLSSSTHVPLHWYIMEREEYIQYTQFYYLDPDD